MLEDLFSVVKVRFNGDKADDDKKKTDIPKGLLFKCPRCRNVTFMEEFQANGKVCPHCNYHSRLTAKERLDITIDKGSFEEFDKDMVSKNPIDFPDYEAKQQALREKTGLKSGHTCISSPLPRNSVTRSNKRREDSYNRYGFQLYDGFHGQCCGRKDNTSYRIRHRK